MDDKQLNFSRPLLSVRRVPSTLSSEKGESRKPDLSEPKIPNPPSYKSELKSGPIRNAGTVPFVWERSPGRPKDENIPQNLAVERPPIAPKLPPGRILRTKEDSDKNPEHPSLSKRHGEVLYGPLGVSALNELESSEDTIEAESSVSGEGDEAYMDALDTLSRAESSFINCSESGVSGVNISNVNTSGTFSTDPQTRDFMMGRFLPAARAMVSETPKYSPKKQPLVREQPRQVKKVTSVENGSPLRYEFNDIAHYALKKDEESDDDYEGHGQFPAKICGVLPRFLLKSSLCLLNPVPGTGVRSMRTRVPMSPGGRTHASSSSTGSSCETENEVQSEPLSCPFYPKKLEGSSLYRRLQSRGTPPSTHNESPQSALSETKEFRTIPAQAKDAEVTGYRSNKKDGGPIDNLSADLRSQGQPEMGSPVIEKTLHVDIVHKVESPDLCSCDFITTGEGAWNDILKWKDMENPSENGSYKVPQNQNVEDEENLKISHKVVDLSAESVPDKSIKVLVFEQNNALSNDLSNSAKAATGNMSKTFEILEPPRTKDIEKSSRSQDFPVPPPLPKSPSDSWLWRTLPSRSSRTPSFQSNVGKPGNQFLKTHAKLRT